MTATTVAVQETAEWDLGPLLDAGDGALVTLVSGQTRLAAHAAVLAARSPLFAAMFQRGELEAGAGEVTVPDVEGPVLRQLVAFCYTGRVPQLPGVAPQLLAAASRYGVSALEGSCEQLVSEHLSVENAAAAAVLAVSHSCHKLKRAAVAFIKAHLEVMATQGWAEAVRSHPDAVVEVTRLLAEPPVETSVSAAADRRPSSNPNADALVHSERGQIPVTAAPATARHLALPLNAATVSRYRNLSAEEKAERLIEAARDGSFQVMRTLLAAGADVGAEERNESKWTALHWAADGGHLEAVQCLLQAGAEVDCRTSRRATPLQLAATRGHAAVVQLLLECSADPNVRNVDRLTPLHWAAARGHAEVVTMLLEAGADRGAKNMGERTPLDGAREKNHQDIIKILEKM